MTDTVLVLGATGKTGRRAGQRPAGDAAYRLRRSSGEREVPLMTVTPTNQPSRTSTTRHKADR